MRIGKFGRLKRYDRLFLSSCFLLQFYKVEVKVIPPEGKGQPKIRSVLRRYTHFTRLFEKVTYVAGTSLGPLYVPVKQPFPLP